MSSRISLPVTLCAALLMVPSGAVLAESPIAQVLCSPREQMMDKLTRQFRSERIGMGLRTHETVIEVWASPGGDWTLVQSYAGGMMCILAMGSDWTPAEGPA